MLISPALLAQLFETEITESRDVTALTESEHPTATLAIAAAEPELAEVGDKPDAVHEAVDGFIVSGAGNAVMLGNDGAIRMVAAMQAENASNDTMIGSVQGRSVSDDTFLQVTKDMLPTMEKHGELNFIGFRNKEGNLVAMSTLDHTTGKTHYFVPVPGKAQKKVSVEAVKKAVSKLKESLDAIGSLNEAEGEGDATEAATALQDHLTEAYMAIADQVGGALPYDPDAPFSVYGTSINVRADSFIAKTPDYGVANYVIRLALAEAMETMGETLANAIRGALAKSEKVKALEIELREVKAKKKKTDEALNEDDAGSQANPEGPVYDEAQLREVIKTAHDKVNLTVATKLGPDDDATDYLGGSKNSERRAYEDARRQLGQRLERDNTGGVGKWVTDPGHFTGGGVGKGDVKESAEQKPGGSPKPSKSMQDLARANALAAKIAKKNESAIDEMGTEYESPERAKNLADAKAKKTGIPHHVVKLKNAGHVVTSNPDYVAAEVEKGGKHIHTTESIDEADDDGTTKSDNVSHGFHGTVAKHFADQGHEDPEHEAAKAFHHAAEHIVNTHGVSHLQARNYLDSAHGRHLADYATASKPKSGGHVKIGDALKKMGKDGTKAKVEAASANESIDEGVLYEKGDFVSKGGATFVVQASTGDEITVAPVKIEKDENRFKITGAAITANPSEINFLGKSVAEAILVEDEIAEFQDLHKETDPAKLTQMHATAAKLYKNATKASQPYYAQMLRRTRKQALKHGAKLEAIDEAEKGLFPGEGNGTVSPYAGKDDDGDDDSTGEDPDETVAVIVKGPKGLELRAGYDGEGALIASESCDPEDADDAKEAQGRLASKAQEQGYVYVPHNMKEAYAHVENALIPLMLEAQGKENLSIWVDAAESAMVADEPGDVLTAAQCIAELAGKELMPGIVEGLHARAHKRGRRPGLRARFKMPKGKKPQGKTGPGHSGTMSHAETGKQGIKIHEGCTGEGCTHAAHEAAADGQDDSKTGVPSTGPVGSGKLKDTGPGVNGQFADGAKGKKGINVGVKEADTNQELPEPNTASIRKPKTAGPQNLIPQGNTPGKADEGELDESLYGFAMSKDVAHDKAKEYSKEKKATYHVVSHAPNKHSKAAGAASDRYGFHHEDEKAPLDGKRIATYRNGVLSEGDASEGTSKDSMSKECACPNCENTADITVGKSKVTCGNCGYSGSPADFQLPSTVGDMAEAWLEAIRPMGVQDFVEDITARAEKDTDEEFASRVAALREAYREGTRKKDIARKITAANPIVKKRMGKGISLEGIEPEGATGNVRITFPKGRVDEFLKHAQTAGSDGSGEIVAEDATIHALIPAGTAAKIKALFNGPGISYVAA